MRSNQNVKSCVPFYENSAGDLVDDILQVQILLQPNGQASTVTLGNADFQLTSLEACISFRVKEMDFPEFTGDAQTYRVSISPD